MTTQVQKLIRIEEAAAGAGHLWSRHGQNTCRILVGPPPIRADHHIGRTNP